MSILTKKGGVGDLTEPDEKVEHVEHIPDQASSSAVLPNYRTWRNNTASSWWNDAGLRRCMFDIVLLYGTVYANGYDSSLVTSLQANESWLVHFQPNSTTLGLTVSAYWFPNLIFPLLGSYLGDRYGRKPIVFVASVFGIVGPLLSGLGSTTGTFIGGRVITGVACSFFQVTAAPLIAEIAHPRFRAIASGTYLVWYSIGAAVCGLVGIGMVEWNGKSSWRVITVLQCLGVIPLVIWSILPWMCESPRYLVKRGRGPEALRVLAILHANGDEEDELVVNEYQEIVQGVELDANLPRSGYLDFLKTPGNRKRLALICFVSWIQSMSGNNLVAYYLPKILVLAGISSFVKIQAVGTGFYVWLVIVGATAGQLVERLGRRKLLLTSLIGLAFCFTVLTATSGSFANTGKLATGLASVPVIFITGAFYVFGLVPMPYMYIPEILPYDLRSKGMAIYSFLTAAGLVFGGYVNPIALAAIGWKYYIVYCVTDVLQAILAYFIIVETRGLTLEDISGLFEGFDERVAV